MDMVRRALRKSTNTRRGLIVISCSIVISVFAIVILSAIGSMFANNNHIVMGAEEDPEDGGKVAAAVFGAVAVYGVSISTRDESRWNSGDTMSVEGEEIAGPHGVSDHLLEL